MPAADGTFHTALLARGYRLMNGHHYEAPSGDDTPLSVIYWFSDSGSCRLERIEYTGRGFDAIVGPTLARCPRHTVRACLAMRARIARNTRIGDDRILHGDILPLTLRILGVGVRERLLIA